MPKIPKNPTASVPVPRAERIKSEAYASSVARIVYNKSYATRDMYRLSAVFRAYFETHPEAMKDFVEWYENL